MGKQTCAVMVAVVAIHVALILMVISVATPMWLEGNLASNATHHNTTHNSTVGNETIPTNYTKVNKGLWNICFDDTCHGVYSFENVDQSAWFKASVVLAVLGTLGTFTATCMYYAFLLMSSLRTNTKYFYLMLIIQVVAALEFTATVVIFVARQREQEDNPLMAGESLDLDLGWSFYVGLGALLSAWIAAGANMKEGCLLRRDDAPYENL